MNETHFTTENIKAYFERRLSPQETLNLFTHLESCKTCANYYDRVHEEYRTPSSFVFDFSIKESESLAHLDYEEIAAFVMGKVDESEMDLLEHHIGKCPACSKALENYITENIKINHSIISSRISSRKSATTFQSLQQTIYGFIASLRLSPAFAAVVFILIVAGLILILLLKDNLGTKPIIAANVNSIAHPQEIKETSPTPNNSNINNSNIDDKERAVANQKPFGKNINLKPKERFSISQNVSEQKIVVEDSEGQIVLNRSGELETSKDFPELLREDAIAALNGKLILPPSMVVKEATESIKTRGDGTQGKLLEPVELISPVAKSIRTDRPLLKWQQHKEATSYCVIITDNKFNVVIQSPMLTQTEWQVEIALKREAVTYYWQVKAYKDDVELPVAANNGARFNIISEAKNLEISNMEKRTKSHFALGLIYLKAGLIDEAERELCSLQKLNSHSNSVQKFLARICRVNNLNTAKLRC